MDELIKALKNFIVRDIIYIIGGASVILSFLYLFDNICIITGSKSKVVYLYAIGISYVIGYCLQEIFSLLRVVTTANYFQPWFPLRWLYRCLVGEKWEDIFPDIQNGRNHRQNVSKKLREADIIINEKASQDNKTFRERITSLMMIGTTIGPCGLVSGILLLTKASFINTNCTFKFNIWLAIGVLVISVPLIILGWIKGLELMKNTEDLYNHYKTADSENKTNSSATPKDHTSPPKP